MRVLDLFTGIGGFSLGLQRAGLTIIGQSETDGPCREILHHHWPEITNYGNVKVIDTASLRNRKIGLVCGGDPCQSHSLARSGCASSSPDLSGYFLSVVARLLPRWVVRENVPTPDVAQFDCCLAALGYGTVIIRMDAAPYTGQSKKRDFIVGRHCRPPGWVRNAFADFPGGSGPRRENLSTKEVAPCIGTHRLRYDPSTCYVWRPGRGLYILAASECERLSGFPVGWTKGFPPSTRRRMLANSVVPQIVEEIGIRIMRANSQ